jgi:hypothetical protein
VALVCLALAAAAFGLYARTGGFGFTNLDDLAYVADNPHLAHGLGASSVAWAFTTLDQEFWHPLTWLSYLVDVSLFGLRPGPMHLVNAGLHAASAVLLFLSLWRLTRAAGPSAWVAALFAVHPMRVESVAWISERKDVLSVFFGLLALLAYAGYARRPRPWRMALVVLAFAASLMAKSTLVTLPFLLLVLDAWPLGRLRWRPGGAAEGAEPADGEAPRIGWTRAVVEKLPLLALSVASASVTLVAQTRGGAVGADAGSLQPGNAVVAYVAYLGKLLWPTDLAVFYPLRLGGEPLRAVLGALAILGLVTAAAVAARRRAPAVLVGWLWFAGTLLPVCGLVQVGAHAMADRYTYFPSIGLCVALVWGLRQLRWQPLAHAAPAAGMVLLAVLALLTDRQVRLWSDDEQLFRQAIAVTGPNVRAQEMLANVLQSRGRDEEAYDHLQEAVRILPNPHSLAAAGRLLVKLGYRDRAEKIYQVALHLDPAQEEAALGLSRLLVEDGRGGEAAEVLAAAVQAAPEGPAAERLRQALAGLGGRSPTAGRVDSGASGP